MVKLTCKITVYTRRISIIRYYIYNDITYVLATKRKSVTDIRSMYNNDIH